MLGRSFTASEDTAGGPRAVVLSYGLFKNTFNGDANLVGHAIRLKGVPYTVIGVLPPGAQTPSRLICGLLFALKHPRRAGEITTTPLSG